VAKISHASASAPNRHPGGSWYFSVVKQHVKWRLGHAIGVCALTAVLCSSPTDRPPMPPLLTAMQDTVVAVRDTVALHATAQYETPAAFYWQFSYSDSTRADTTADSVVTVVFDTGQAGTHAVTVRCRAANGTVSEAKQFAVEVRQYRPLVQAPPDCSTPIRDSLAVLASGTDTNGTVVAYEWRIDTDSVIRATGGPVLTLWFDTNMTGVHCVRVVALDDDGLRSAPDSMFIGVRLLAPVVAAPGDTAVAINDSITFVAAAYDSNGLVAEWVWSIDGGRHRVISDSAGLRWSWPRTDTGSHLLVVTVIDTDGVVSRPDTCEVLVRLLPPTLTAMTDTAVCVCDTVWLHVSATDSNGTVRHYVWSYGAVSSTTQQPLLPVIWSSLDTGTQVVTVHAVDDDTVESSTDTIRLRVRLCAPAVTAMADTSVCINDTLLLQAQASDTNGLILGYVWDFGNRVDTSAAGAVPTVWTRRDTGAQILVVRAFDDDSIASPPDTVAVRVRLCAPTLTAMADTSVWINDTLQLQAQAADSNGRILGYAWDFGDHVDTSTVGTVSMVWTRLDTGAQTIMVRAFDDDSVASPPDTVHVLVRSGPPTAALSPHAVAAAINDTVVLRASGSDPNGSSLRYIWWHTGQAAADSLDSDTLALVLRRADTGQVNVVRVQALDDATLLSQPDSCLVTVHVCPPRLVPEPDTLINTADTLHMDLLATDSNGTIAAYYLDIGADGWDDSAPVPAWRAFYGGDDSVPVVWGARDDDSTLVLDTFVIAWNQAPDSVSLFGPIDTALVWGTALVRNERRVRFSMRGYDVDTPIDTLTFTLALGRDSLPFDTVYRGTDTFFVADTLDTGFYRWQLQASDLRGLAVRDTGSFVVIRERRICFLGHSILVGLAGNNLQGGFRKEVMDSMRTRLGRYEKLRPMGHMLSYMMQPPELDSCLGRSGAVSYELWDTLRHATWVNADCWVMMLGVNGDYNWSEQRYSQRIIDTAIYRNTECEVHFLNGLPIPDTLTWPQPTNANRDVFNVFIELVAQTRRDYGYSVNVVDAYSVLSVDSVFNDTLMSEYLRPSQLG